MSTYIKIADEGEKIQMEISGNGIDLINMITQACMQDDDICGLFLFSILETLLVKKKLSIDKSITEAVDTLLSSINK